MPRAKVVAVGLVSIPLDCFDFCGTWNRLYRRILWQLRRRLWLISRVVLYVVLESSLEVLLFSIAACMYVMLTGGQATKRQR